MTQKDQELIAKAKKLDCIRWFDINEMIETADTDEAKKELDRIQTRKIRAEEYHTDRYLHY